MEQDTFPIFTGLQPTDFSWSLASIFYMKNLLIFVILHGLVFSSLAQEPTRKDWKYKPVDLEDAIKHLNKLTDDSSKIWIMNLEENEYVGQVHFSQGRWIRNKWHLWKGGELSDYFNSLGIEHPDDMSRIIFRSFYRELKGIPWNVEERVIENQNYWSEQDEQFFKMISETAYSRVNFGEQERQRFQYYEEKISGLSPGSEVYAFVPRNCGLYALFHVHKAKVYGTVLEHGSWKVKVSITSFDDIKYKKAVERCNDIEGNSYWIPLDDVVKVKDANKR